MFLYQAVFTWIAICHFKFGGPAVSNFFNLKAFAFIWKDGVLFFCVYLTCHFLFTIWGPGINLCLCVKRAIIIKPEKRKNTDIFSLFKTRIKTKSREMAKGKVKGVVILYSNIKSKSNIHGSVYWSHVFDKLHTLSTHYDSVVWTWREEFTWTNVKFTLKKFSQGKILTHSVR